MGIQWGVKMFLSIGREVQGGYIYMWGYFILYSTMNCKVDMHDGVTSY